MPNYTREQYARFAALNIPYVCLEPEEVEIYDRLLELYKPRACLEWGSGWSTIYFPSRHACVERWVAVEHNAEWVARLDQHGLPPAVELYHATGDDYVWLPFGCAEQYDWIVVDGVQRAACMLAAARLLAPGGRCLLHDTGRVGYRKWFEVFDGWETLAQGRPTGRGMVLLWNE